MSSHNRSHGRDEWDEDTDLDQLSNTQQYLKCLLQGIAPDSMKM